MLAPVTVPPGLLAVLAAVAPCFTAPSFATFTALVTGMLSVRGRATVTGMWDAAGLAGRVHWGRAHRFFSQARWDTDALGLTLAAAVLAAFVPGGSAVTVAVDDTLFRRVGKKVYGARWQHDGSARGRDGLGRGNCLVIVCLVVVVPFMARPVSLPVLLRLHIPKSTESKTVQARAMVDLLAGQFPDRTFHVVGDALYRGPVWRELPEGVTFTTRLAKTAVLYGRQPPPTGKRGHPRWKGDRLGTPADLAAQADTEGTWRTTTVDRYGRCDTIEIAEVACLWWGSLHRTLVRVILTRDPAGAGGVLEMALVTTDLDTSPEQVVERYAPAGRSSRRSRTGRTSSASAKPRAESRQRSSGPSRSSCCA